MLLVLAIRAPRGNLPDVLARSPAGCHAMSGVRLTEVLPGGLPAAPFLPVVTPLLLHTGSTKWTDVRLRGGKGAPFYATDR